MKKLPFVILLLAVAACSSKKHSTSAAAADTVAIAATASIPAADNDSVTVSAEGIGDFKIGMNIQSVEKLLNRKLTNVPPPKDQGNGYGDARDTVRGIDPDTLSFNYRNVDYQRMFSKGWQEDSTYAVTISRVISRSRLLKTPAGIGIGDDKSKIISAYDNKNIQFDRVLDAYTPGPRPWKGKSIITVTPGYSGNIVVFYMVHDKVDGMRVDARVEGD
jgi:hypothetical protein